ncbi:hypothetical protein A2914_01025 [Candidatus Nomurabacteria bacterium RIFCSPLOWO2_01_FULL_41_21]|uniref:HXXEE domain-containing protein n=2 Tax=Candidatus Nomuraibacteriota TaxID=1752729 RepID=A0A1F6V274_9BACT|nr:MAG: hypothetical protein A2733_02115 [Candidatus Nomurabacteria bacterium RIFCSPHIGHO2_01_FULL_40_20]OGI87897.1 MAG: hypothetical protein A2914_01025 [Candidatus Nomurabacteria bacterium RIFCSPLOWO2_01_FULL_41_21]
MKRVESFVHVLVPLFVVHFLEEIFTDFASIDLSVLHLSKYFNLDQQITFSLIQIALFLFLAVLLVLVLSKKRIPFILSLIFSIISLYEFSHVYEALKTQSYYPGLITGVIITIVGVVFVYKLLTGKFNYQK